ncbi:MAG: O-antigen ligase family protein [Candidatus Omnitrophota bacterium]|nr:O-antigen ligase family protein [Candidatus Omnitrophota bacterium]
MDVKKKEIITLDFRFLLLVLFLMPIAGIYSLMNKPVQIADLLFLAFFLIWLPRRILAGKFRLNAKFRLFLAMLIVFCISAYFSPLGQISLAGLAIKMYLLSLAYVISEEIDSAAKFRMALDSILFSGLYVIAFAFSGIVFFMTGRSSVFLCPPGILDLPLRFLPRVQSVFSSPSFLSSFLIIIMMLLVEKASSCGSCVRRRLYLVYLILSAAALFFTFSRDIIGLGWGLIFLFMWRGVKRRAILSYSKLAMFLITVCVLVLTVWYIFPVTVYKTSPDMVPMSSAVQYKLDGGAIINRMGWVSEKFVSFNAHLHNRFIELRDSGRTFVNHPLLGIGVGVLPSQGYFTAPYSRSAHNTYLQVLAQTGILGFIVSLVFIISLFRILRAQGRDSPLYGTKLVFKAILVIFLVNMFFIDLDNFRYFWIIAGLIFSLKNIEGEKNA